MSVKKIYATPHEPHTWFEAFESPEERRLRAEVREFAWANFEHQRDDCDAKFRCKHLLPLVAEQGYLATLVAKEHGGEGQGLGISVIPWQAAADDVREKQLFCSRIAGHTLTRQTGWIYPKMSRLPRMVAEVMKVAEAVKPRLNAAVRPDLAEVVR